MQVDSGIHNKKGNPYVAVMFNGWISVEWRQQSHVFILIYYVISWTIDPVVWRIMYTCNFGGDDNYGSRLGDSVFMDFIFALYFPCHNLLLGLSMLLTLLVLENK